MASNSPMGLPNCLRSCAYLVAASQAPCAMPSASAAMEIRPPSRICRLLTKPSPSLAQQIFLGHAAIGEHDFGSVAGAHAELVFFFAGAKAGRSLFDDEGGDAVGTFALVGDGHGHADVGIVAVGGEGFRAVDHPAEPVRPAPRDISRRCACRRRRSRLRARSATSSRAFCPARAARRISAAAPRCRICRCGWCRANCAPPR